MQVYLLWHVHELAAGQDDEKLIGVYSSKDEANEALKRAKHLPGFCELPDGFVIAPYTLDEDYWLEGYCTVYPNEF
jgi:hypothetical protein